MYEPCFRLSACRAGSFIAAAKNAPDEVKYGADEPPSMQNPRASRPTSSLFNWANFDATRLSPFYHSTPPDLEACNADLEGEVIVNALRRLSGMPTGICSTTLGSSPSPSSASLPRHRSEVPHMSVTEELSQVLLLDTEAYLASLLFKPQTLPPSQRHSQHTRDEPAPSPSYYRHLSPYQHPYSSISPSIAPSSSRAWATAAYLYLHVVLEFLWNPRESVDQHLMRWLLDSLRADISSTEEAMRIGAYSSELWIWKLVVGAYSLTVASVSPQAEAWAANPGLVGADEEGVDEMIGLRIWFDEKIRSWTQAAKTTE